MRYRTLILASSGLAMIFSLAACGDEHARTLPAERPSGSPADDLTIQVKASAQAPATTYRLTCGPAGGDHPKAADACAALAKVKDPFAPVPKDRMCTDIYGGPEVATVKGTWQGRPVDTTFKRNDGCQLHRWSEIAPVFGPVPKVR